MTRRATNRILEMIDDGTLSADSVARAALRYMSEDDVADMAAREYLLEHDDEEEADDDASE